MELNMKDIRITVLKTTFNAEIAAEYGAPDVGTCPMHQVGDTFLARGGMKPPEICDEAWTAIGKYAFALAHGLPHFWLDWIDKPYVSINSCNDGLRPVIFKLEVVDPESEG
jgi:uncharacterized repeat protein (TIGR04076 family)